MAERVPDPAVEIGDGRETASAGAHLAFAELAREGRPAALVTVVGASGSTPRGLGATMAVRPDGSVVGTVGGGALEHDAVKRALASIADGRPRRLHYDFTAGPERNLGMACAGTVDLFVLPATGGPALHVFGSGHVARALAPMALAAGYRVTVLDDREGFPRPGDFPEGVALRPGPYDAAGLPFDGDSTFVVVATHGHDRDEAVLRLCLPRPWRYLGMIGSRSKVRQAFRAIGETAEARARLEEVRAPIGLDLGGRSPGEIAVSILAECQAVRHSKQSILPMSAAARSAAAEGEEHGSRS